MLRLTAAQRAAVGVTIGIVLGIVFKEPFHETHSHGFVHSTLENVRNSFDEILSHEREGVALAAYHNGELIVDLWGGHADRSALREWSKDTMSVTFSTTKAIASLIMALLVSRGHVQYEDTVVKHWPEFGQHGKHNITLQWILDHKSGLIKFDEELELDRVHDAAYVSKIIEESTPMWPAGTQIGYHAITFGWLLDQIVRRVDKKKRSIGQFFREEIRPIMKDQDYYVGLPRSEHHRMARLVPSTTTEYIKAVVLGQQFRNFAWNSMWVHENLFNDSCNYPRWMAVMTDEIPYNNPQVREVENMAALGIGTARGLAAAASAFLEHDLISEVVWKELKQPVGNMFDRVAKNYILRGHGFYYEPHPALKHAFILTHPGHGRQKIIIDPVSKTTVALIRNLVRFDEASEKATDNIASQILRSTNK